MSSRMTGLELLRVFESETSTNPDQIVAMLWFSGANNIHKKKSTWINLRSSVKAGDLVKSIYGLQLLGIIVDVDPLRQPLHDDGVIVVMLDIGVLWRASPDAWKVVNESR
jgi:hypothetical protein